MSSPASIPVIPPQPSQETYTPDVLALFQTYTRDSYLAAFSVQAPPWDSSRTPKAWFDSTADATDPANVTVYKIAGTDSNGAPALKQMVLAASEAAAINLPGAITYSPYIVTPANVTRGGALVNFRYLSLEADARALMATLQGTDLVLEPSTPESPIIYPAGEPRRLWEIVINGVPMNVGLFIAEANAQGVGYPGHWETSAAVPLWIPDPPAPTGIDDRRPWRPVPLRALFPNEKLQPGPMGMGALVVRTDLQQTRLVQGGAFLPEDRLLLQQIYDAVRSLDK